MRKLLKMREKDFSLCAWLSVLVLSLPRVYCSGWKPIAPPENYYATTPKTCDSDCEAGYKYPYLGGTDGTQSAESQITSTLLNPSVAFNQEKAFHQSNKKLDLEIFKPTEVSFFPTGDAKTLDSSPNGYHEVFHQTPTGYFSFKTYDVPGKQGKTVYYGDLELAKPKFGSDVKYYKPYKQSLKNDFKVFNPANFHNFYQSTKGSSFGDHCSLYKVSFRQDLYYQYIQYKVHMPELKEFTLCVWMRFHNHSHDHSVFSYGVKHQRQAIYMWVSNLNEPGLFNMKVLGHTIFRLNYPIKLYKWYHTCQSWNGNTGEWQVWVDSHRIARGFHNLLVKHPIPGGGIAISGQEHRHFSKGFQEIPHFLKGTGGLEGEITMLQLYKVALTAGKAYNDHSHHHSHYTSTTPEPPELPTEEPSTTTEHPLLENGQLKKHVNVLELAEALKKGQLDTPEQHHQPHQPHQAPLHFLDAPVHHSYTGHLAPVVVQGDALNFVGFPSHAIFKRNDETKAQETQAEGGDEDKNKKPERVVFVTNVSDQVQIQKVKFSDKSDKEAEDEDEMMALPHQIEIIKSNITSDASGENMTDLYSIEDETEEKNNSSGVRFGRRLRRQNSQPLRIAGNRTKRITAIERRPLRYIPYGVKKRVNVGKGTSIKSPGNSGKEALKRQVVLEDSYLNFGSVGLTSPELYPAFGSLPSTGFAYEQFPQIGQEHLEAQDGAEENGDDPLSGTDDSDNKIRKEVELAEGEVRRVMELCSGCQVDPFRKVAVISWRSTPKKIYSGTLFLKAKSECENF